MIRIGNIVREVFDDIKETTNEIVIHENCTQAHNQLPAAAHVYPKRTQIFNLDPLYPRHLIHKVHQQTMKTGVAIQIRSSHRLYKLEETRKRALLIQHLKHCFILSPVKEDE